RLGAVEPDSQRRRNRRGTNVKLKIPMNVNDVPIAVRRAIDQHGYLRLHSEATLIGEASDHLSRSIEEHLRAGHVYVSPVRQVETRDEVLVLREQLMDGVRLGVQKTAIGQQQRSVEAFDGHAHETDAASAILLHSPRAHEEIHLRK